MCIVGLNPPLQLSVCVIVALGIEGIVAACLLGDFNFLTTLLTTYFAGVRNSFFTGAVRELGR